MYSNPNGDILESFDTIALEGMDSVKLMNRIDTKFVTTLDKLKEILKDARDGYLVLETDGKRLHGYDSTYYDTDSLEMYRRHHDGRLTRYKIRTRTYLDNGQSFLEVKKKDNHARSIKSRIHIDGTSDWSDTDAGRTFISDSSPYEISDIFPSLKTSFNRITLVDRLKTERITIDTDLFFENHRTGIRYGNGQLVIIELKQNGHCVSFMRNILRDKRIHPYRISKYCIGCVLTDNGLKRNRFIPKLRYIDKITSNHITQC